MTFSLHGIGASKGIAIGKVHIVMRGVVEVPEYRLRKSQIEKEVRRFKKAMEDQADKLGGPEDEIRVKVVGEVFQHSLEIEKIIFTLPVPGRA